MCEATGLTIASEWLQNATATVSSVHDGGEVDGLALALISTSDCVLRSRLACLVRRNARKESLFRTRAGISECMWYHGVSQGTRRALHSMLSHGLALADGAMVSPLPTHQNYHKSPWENRTQPSCCKLSENVPKRLSR